MQCVYISYCTDFKPIKIIINVDNLKQVPKLYFKTHRINATFIISAKVVISIAVMIHSIIKVVM